MQPLGTSVSGASRLPSAGICLVVDAGRTHCRAALYRDGEAGFVTGPGLPGVAEGGGSAEPFMAALGHLLDGLALPSGPLDAVCVGMTGVLRPGPAADAVAKAVHALLPAGRVLVTSDVVTGYCGAVGLGSGVVVAAGTGMIALGVGERGVARVDGWGYMLGDAGSGYEIGRRGLAAALRAHDGRAGSARLAELAAARFGPLDEVIATVYGAANPVGVVAGFAASVADAARAGDALARWIWADAAAEVAASALAAASRSLGTDEPAVLSWTGGLFDAADLLLEPFLAHLAARRPALAARPPLGSALDGGRLLAAAPDGHPLLELVHVATA
jgi:N-acetylglucosamine kinase-like BadF-type ATPase